MVKSYLSLTCILATWAAAVVAVSGGAQSAPSTGVDCSTLIFDMMDCISFLSGGDDETKPDSACCSGLESVLKTDADCICYAISNAGSLGLVINMTKAETLPSQCGVSAPPISSCNVSTSPSASPANPPSSSSAPVPSNYSPSTAPVPATTPLPSAAAPSPAEAPKAPSPAQSPETAASTRTPDSSSPAEAPAPSSSARGVPPSEATKPNPANSGYYTTSSAFSAFLVAMASNFLLFNA